VDFYKIRKEMKGKGESAKLEIYPDFQIRMFKDFMIRGHAFYAIWDEKSGLWSTHEYKVKDIIDDSLENYESEMGDKYDCPIIVDYMGSYRSSSWKTYSQWIKTLPDQYHQLDEKLIFANTVTKREDYASKKLPYPLEEGKCPAFDEIISTLYDDENRAKLEWAIGSVVAGDSTHIQKFIVLYGAAGAGKSTMLNIIDQLFEGYSINFDAKSLAMSNNIFATEVFKSNPLVAIQHDGDLSRIEDNTKLNSIVSHENMLMNEKYKASYSSKVNAFLFMATNKPVKITDAKSGIIRRLIDVRPSGNKIDADRYSQLMSQIKFELGAIAYKCWRTYLSMGEHYYDSYRPIDMMFKTDVFFNFVEDSYPIFNKQDGTTLKQAYEMYKVYCNDAKVEYPLAKYRFREELKNYFQEFKERDRAADGNQIWHVYKGFLSDKFSSIRPGDVDISRLKEASEVKRLELRSTKSIFDKEMANCVAQYATARETPQKKWAEVKTTLKDLDTTKVHYVKVPTEHIVIDFDLKDESGEKSKKLNLEAAAKWPETYAEFSKGGSGVHLHYIYDGDPKKLSSVYSEGIEVKVFYGRSALRRRLTKCNNLPIAHISSGLPLKGETDVINFKSVKSERSLRAQIERNLNKEIHPGTKPSIDFIYKILEDAYSSGLKYDVSDMYQRILLFANNSSHQAAYCVKLVSQMKFKSEEPLDATDEAYPDGRLVFFDVEVFPNLFLVNWKYEGESSCVRMINPEPGEIEQLMRQKLIGFNCRKYDNHILYARYLGYTNMALYNLSQRIVSGDKNAFFSEAYSISYTDVYDFASAGNKMSLKKWEIKLGIHHQELGLPWDKPVPEEDWIKVAEYCDNDVISTEAVFNHLSGDWAARQILAELSGLSVNDSTNQHSARIIFGGNRHPQDEFVYTDLSETFPGYSYELTKKGIVSTYMGETTGEGGYVYSEPGMYTNVGLFDIASMHPSSIEALNLFGPYTQRFSDIKNGRVYVKHEDWKKAKEVLDGQLTPFVEQIENGTSTYSSKDLAAALKTVINSVYGLTSAKFDNIFRDPRNVDNIVAKRGALFMINLKHECQKRGWTVVHIKTDSIKLANVTQEMADFVTEYGKQYGYTFEHESTYDRMCIVNESVYIAHSCYGEHYGSWFPTGAQFAQPYIYKTLFSHEQLTLEDKCETKAVTTAMYLDMNEDLPEDEHAYSFVGKVGQFCPIKKGCGGGLLVREKNEKYYAVTGTKGYRWLESEMVRALDKADDIDESYYHKLVDDAIESISKYGDFEWFVDPDTLPAYSMRWGQVEDSDAARWCRDPENVSPDISQCENCKENCDCEVVNGE
jgi:energy-coupling factor transporter ATP-binding protein EcfA2